MASPEMTQRLEGARVWRSNEATAISKARAAGLRADTVLTPVLKENPQYQATRELTIFDRWEKLASKVPEFSEETWEIAGRVFSGINNGVKAALLVDITQNTKPGTYMPIESIVDHFRELFAGTKLLESLRESKATRSQVIDYCQQSLCDVGVLTAEYNLEGKPIGFGVTENGLNFGLPHALRILGYENIMNVSIYPIIGVTNSGGATRAPFNRARMLEYLFRHPYNVRDVDLKDLLKVYDATISNALKDFRNFGLADYKALTTRRREPFEYTWDTNKDFRQTRYYSNGHEIQDVAIRAIQQKGLANPSTLRFSIDDIIQEFPEDIKERWKEKSLRTILNHILNGLAGDGLLQRVDSFKGGEKLSDIALTRKGRSFIMRVILPTLLNSKAEPLLLSDLSELAYTSAELYYPYSSSNNRREYQNNIRELVQIIGEEPQSAQKLSVRVKYTAERITRILRPRMKDSSEVIIKVDGQPIVIVRAIGKDGIFSYSRKNTEDK